MQPDSPDAKENHDRQSTQVEPKDSESQATKKRLPLIPPPYTPPPIGDPIYRRGW